MQHPDNGKLTLAVSTPISEILRRVNARCIDNVLDGSPMWVIDSNDENLYVSIYEEVDETVIAMHRREDNDRLPWFVQAEELTDIVLVHGHFPGVNVEESYYEATPTFHVVAVANMSPIFWYAAEGTFKHGGKIEWSIFAEDGCSIEVLPALHDLADKLRTGMATPGGTWEMVPQIVKVAVQPDGTLDATSWMG